MKFALMVILSVFLTTACSKSDHTIQQGTAPNTSGSKDGSDAGAGPTGSLGSENPSSTDTSSPNTNH